MTTRGYSVIGEAARHLTDEVKARLDQIPWTATIGMRNRLIHEYFRIDLNLLWETVQTDIPALIVLLTDAVPPEAPDEPNPSPDTNKDVAD